MENILVVNYDKYLSDKTISKCADIPESSKKYTRGIVFQLREPVYTQIVKQKNPDILHTSHFWDNVISFHYLKCDTDGCCLIVKDKIDKNVLNALQKDFKNIRANIYLEMKNFKKIIKNLSSLNFTSPKLEDLKTISLELDEKSDHTHDVCNEVDYIISQKSDEQCGISVKFNDDAITFLRKASKMGHSHNDDGSVSQKEISGCLSVKEFSSDHIATIGVDKHTLELGEEENVNVKASRYNFHSHPEEAYVKYSINKAWPSIVDYLGYFALGNRTILHCVATLEGVYVISFHKDWVDDLKSVSKKFIDKTFDISHQLNYTPEEYVNNVNSIVYTNKKLKKSGHIFKLQYLPWDRIKTVFKVVYGKEGLTCFMK
jgi:hypothetical protein